MELDLEGQHAVPDYIAAARAAGLFVGGCREWKPSDFPADAPARVSRRGVHMPLAIEFRLTPDAKGAA